MRILGIWRRLSGEALRWRGTAAAVGTGKLWHQEMNLSSDAGSLEQRQMGGRSRASVTFGSRAVAADHLLYSRGVRKLSFSSLYSRGARKLSFSSFATPLPKFSGQADEGLLHVLRCEVVDLTKKSQNIAARKPPNPFTLVKDEAGELEMTLTRIYGLEDISLFCVLQLVPKEYQRTAEIGEDPEARQKMLQMTISITKGAAYPVLAIRCECYRDGFAIHQVDLESEDKEQSVYRPYFSEMKRELVNNFQIFLYDRGLNADLANYIEMHLERKRLLKSALVIENMTTFLV